MFHTHDYITDIVITCQLTDNAPNVYTNAFVIYVLYVK